MNARYRNLDSDPRGDWKPTDATAQGGHGTESQFYELAAPSGKIKDAMKNALLRGTLDLPKKFEAARSRFENIITRADQRPPLRDASREVTVRLNKQVLISPEFLELWDKIKQKTAYRVQIDTEKLVDWSIRDLRAMPPIPKARLMTQTADINIENAGVTHFERGMKVTDLESTYETLPHIISIISEETLMKRATVRRILMESGRSGDFLHNPQAFLEQALTIIGRNRYGLAIDGIKYVKLDGQEYYAMEIFEAAELTKTLENGTALRVARSWNEFKLKN